MVATFEMFEGQHPNEEPEIEFVLSASQFRPFEIDPNLFGTAEETEE